MCFFICSLSHTKKTEPQLISKKTYIDYLEKPNENFGDMPVCPFVKAERENDDLMVEVWYPNKTSFVDVLEKFNTKSTKECRGENAFLCIDFHDETILAHGFRTTVQRYAWFSKSPSQG